MTLASFPTDCVHSPLALQWRNLQIYAARPQLNRLTSFEIQGARTMMQSKVAYSAGVGGARFRRKFRGLGGGFVYRRGLNDLNVTTSHSVGTTACSP